MIEETRQSGAASLEKLLVQFEERNNTGAFPYLSRASVARQLRRRLVRPGSINQGSSSLCGPAVFLNSLLKDDPARYVRYVVELFENGHSKLGEIIVEPGVACKQVKLSEDKMVAADWIALASLRDSENRVLDYAGTSDRIAGITLPGKLMSWFLRAGYEAVIDDTRLLKSCGDSEFQSLMTVDLDSYHVCLFVNSTLCHSNWAQHTSSRSSWNPFGLFFRKRRRSLNPNHWVGLSRAVRAQGGTSHFAVNNWGAPTQLISSDPSGGFGWVLGHLYGAVIVKRRNSLNS